ncbi:hypothetical protein V1525DRAFT_225676 [Lipomyces kononenkoae]|uniref:Uncharacterized protein n=1 Tax=Lipomyces kononenkoae TaxID=34357 RepID=A0ACC3TA37_LIPKO
MLYKHTHAGMKASRYATSRQKACQQCSNAKARCDRKTGRCTRCTQRGLSCTYPRAISSPTISTQVNCASGEGELFSPISAFDVPFPSPEGEQPARRDSVGSNDESTQSLMNSNSVNTSSSTLTKAHFSRCPERNSTTRMSTGLEALDFSGLELVCPINADDISNRWLNPYIPLPGQTIKAYPPTVSAFIFRILKSYAAVTVRGRGVVPFVHSSQMTTLSAGSPLSTCLTLVRIFEKQLPGSEGVAAGVLQREMNSLCELRETYDDMTLIAAFQAYLIYSMVLFFRLSQGSNPFLRQAMMNLQEIACASCRRGLVCSAEQQRARPKWEAWIVAEVKRRTLFTMYLFDSILSAQDNLPTFLGTELRGLPAPANKALWQAQSRYDWERAYNLHLVDWTEGGLNIDELWPIPSHLDEAGVAARRDRVDQWLENIDEFGTMIYTVTSCTHGG